MPPRSKHNRNSTFINGFLEYHTPTEFQFKCELSRCTFIVDTSVLLNLYRYPRKTSDDILKILTQLQERLWIPHYVALEFHRGRRSVLREQFTRFDGVEKELNKTKSALLASIEKSAKRHYLIEVESLAKRFNEVFEEAVKKLRMAERELKNIYGEDSILTTLSTIFDKRVGPDNPKLREEVMASGPVRFSTKTPPGYMDSEKSDQTPCLIAGSHFDRRYGDLLIWEQIIAYAKEKSKQSVILVTDDRKEDWWWFDSTKQPRGPRPELVEEIRRRADTQFFYMYTSERFVKYASEHLSTTLDSSTYESVRDIALLPWREQEELFQASALNRLYHKIDPLSHERLSRPKKNRFRRFSESLLGGPSFQDTTQLYDWLVESRDGIRHGFWLHPEVIPRGVSSVSEIYAIVSLYLGKTHRSDQGQPIPNLILVTKEPDELERTLSRLYRALGSSNRGLYDSRVIYFAGNPRDGSLRRIHPRRSMP